jgi:hypothetical protein
MKAEIDLDRANRGMDMFEGLNNQIGKSAGADAHERRRNARYPFTATVEAVESSSKTRIQGRTTDLSRGGCYVDTITSFPAGSMVKMRLTKENRSFEAQAEVVYSLDSMGMGVKFTSTDPEQLWIVEKWIGELSGEVQPEPELPQLSDQSCTKEGPSNKECLVLNELVMELMRQGVLSEAKCRAMLQKLGGTGRIERNSGNA